MKYVYPAIFTPEDDGILVTFPDLPSCYTDGDDINDAFENAEDALALMLWHMEENNDLIPAPTTFTKLKVPAGSSAALIKADTLPVRKMNDNSTVRRNVTLPAWMNEFVKERHINVSKFLQNAICKEYGIL